MPLSTREQAQLGEGRRLPRMGESAFLGIAVRDVQHKFRLEIGPLSADDYNRFLPGEGWVTELRDWVRQYAGVEFEWETRVILRAHAVQGATLGSAGRLGYNTARPSASACSAWRSGVSRRAIILPYTESLLMETNMSEISRAVLFGKLDTLLFTSLESATAFCKLRGNPYVELVHWLHQLMQQQDGDLQQVIRHFALDEQQLTRDIVAALDALPRGASSVSDLSEHIDSAVERARVYGSLKFGVSRIRGGHLLIGILKTWNLANVLKSISAQFTRLNVEVLVEQFDAICASSKESQQAAAAADAPAGAVPAAQGTLAQYGQDLTARAREGKIDPVVGRDEDPPDGRYPDASSPEQPLLTGKPASGKPQWWKGWRCVSPTATCRSRCKTFSCGCWISACFRPERA